MDWQSGLHKFISPAIVSLDTAPVQSGCLYGLSWPAMACQFAVIACPNTFTFDRPEKQCDPNTCWEMDPDKPRCTTSFHEGLTVLSFFHTTTVQTHVLPPWPLSQLGLVSVGSNRIPPLIRLWDDKRMLPESGRLNWVNEIVGRSLSETSIPASTSALIRWCVTWNIYFIIKTGTW